MAICTHRAGGTDPPAASTFAHSYNKAATPSTVSYTADQLN
jgi:hypothetical protein